MGPRDLRSWSKLRAFPPIFYSFFLLLLFFFFFNLVYLLYNVVLVSAVQHSESALCIYIYLLSHEPPSHPRRSSQSTELISLYTLDSFFMPMSWHFLMIAHKHAFWWNSELSQMLACPWLFRDFLAAECSGQTSPPHLPLSMSHFQTWPSLWDGVAGWERGAAVEEYNFRGPSNKDQDGEHTSWAGIGCEIFGDPQLF